MSSMIVLVTVGQDMSDMSKLRSKGTSAFAVKNKLDHPAAVFNERSPKDPARTLARPSSLARSALL